MAVKCKTFEAYIRELIFHPEREKKWMKDRRLTLSEKKILQGHLLVRDNKYQDVISEIGSMSDSDMDFVNDQKHLLLGICYNNTGRYAEGESHLRKAAKSFEEKGHSYHHFTALFNLINNLGNLGKICEMKCVLDRMENLRVSGLLPEIRLLRCQFLYALDSNDHLLAKKLIPKIKKLKADMPESELGPQLICEFIYFIKCDDLDMAEDVLCQMKRHRKFMISENFHFMKKLLSHLREDATIYVYERDFPNRDSVLFLQIKVIEALQTGDKDEALKHWKTLQKNHGSELYQDGFNWSGEKCLFSLCLEKHRKKLNSAPFQVIQGDGPKYQIAYEILKAANGPVKSGELFELLYGEVFEDKEDLKKLALLMMNIRKIYQVDVIARKGTYELIGLKEKTLKKGLRSL